VIVTASHLGRSRPAATDGRSDASSKGEMNIVARDPASVADDGDLENQGKSLAYGILTTCDEALRTKAVQRPLLLRVARAFIRYASRYLQRGRPAGISEFELDLGTLDLAASNPRVGLSRLFPGTHRHSAYARHRPVPTIPNSQKKFARRPFWAGPRDR